MADNIKVKENNSDSQLLLSEQLVLLKNKLCKDFTQFDSEISHHFDAIASTVLEKDGKNLQQMLQKKQKVTATFMETVEKSMRSSILGMRKRAPKKTLPSLTRTNSIQYIPVTPRPFSWSSWFSRAHKERNHDPHQAQAIQNTLKAIHQTGSSFVENQAKSDAINLDLQFIHSLEFLAKQLTYHMCPRTKFVEVSVPINGHYHLVNYAIERIPLWLGTYAYGLKPVSNNDAPPLLLFRGTSPYPSGRGAGISILSNLDPLGVCFQMYQWGKSNIHNWLKKNTNDGKNPAVVAGHSQGGALGTYTAIYENTLVKETYSFNGPGVSFIAERTWSKLKKKPHILNICNKDDIITRLGSSRVGDDYKFLRNEDKLLPWSQRLLRAHLDPLFEDAFVVIKDSIKTIVPVWVHIAFQILILTPIFFSNLAILLTKRIIFGHTYAKPWTYLLGPVFAVSELSFGILRSSYIKIRDSESIITDLCYKIT